MMVPTATLSAPRRSISNAHKAALAKGREEGHVVRRYLDALESCRPRRGRRRTTASIERRLILIDQELERADPMTRLHLLQQQKDLREELEQADAPMDLSELEREFITVAGSYSERKGISYSTWRAAGVPVTVLQQAGIPRTRG